jgi:hypothetical protein
MAPISTNHRLPRSQAVVRANAKAIPVTNEGGGIAAAFAALDPVARNAYAVGEQIGFVHSHGLHQLYTSHYESPAQILKAAPEAAVVAGATPTDLSDLAASLGISSLAGVAGLITVGVGIAKTHVAHKTLNSLNTQKRAAQSKQDGLQTLASETNQADRVRDLAHAQLTERSRIKTFDRGLQHARADLSVGITSTLSGAIGAAQAGADAGSKISLGIDAANAGGSFLGAQTYALGNAQAMIAGNAAAAKTAFAVGLGSTFAAPVVGVMSTIMAGFLTRKSSIKKRQLKRDYALTKKTLIQLRATKYTDFIATHGDRRINFMTKINRWNKNFLVFSGLYTASAAVKATAIGLAVLGGISALATPPVFITVAVVGGLVALGMGISALVSFYRLGKQQRYANHTFLDHAGVDRHFLAALDCQPSASGAPAGLALRAKCLEWLDVRKSFLKGTDGDILGKLKKPSLLDKIGDDLGGKRPRNSSTINGWHRVQHWFGRGPILSVHDIQKWYDGCADNPGRRQILHDALKQDIDARMAFLNDKIAARQEVMDNATLGLPKDVSGAEAEWVDSYKGFLRALNEDMQKDVHALQGCEALQAAQLGDNGGKEAFETQLFDYFGLTPGNKHPIGRLFGEDLYKDVKKARGVLFETELQAARLRQMADQENEHLA